MSDKKTILHAYIDECGTDSLFIDKKDVGRFFICVASIIEEDNIQIVNDAVINLKKTLGMQPEHELKNKKIKSERRIKILQDIAKLPIEFYVFIVDKQQIKEGSGISYKDSFYKYINRRFYQKISKENSCQMLKFFADKIGFKNFQDSFSKYLKPYEESLSLFEPNNSWNHAFKDSKENNLIQISDVIAGTLTKYFSPEKTDDYFTICYNIIEK